MYESKLLEKNISALTDKTVIKLFFVNFSSLLILMDI
jgi:hypothetical protein